MLKRNHIVGVSAINKTLTVLGSTGSVGKNTLDLVERNPKTFNIKALTGNQNVKLLAQQAKFHQPELLVIGNKEQYSNLIKELDGFPVRVEAGYEGLIEAADLDTDLVMASIVGTAGLLPTMRAAKRGATIALANKECLVCAGSLLISEVENSGGVLIPVDSEHNAIFQVFDFDQTRAVKNLILTASGGPFREKTIKEMAKVKPREALEHPNWRMGPKITIDSATMMNKGLELIEAFYLFPVNIDQIKILVHPQSIVHSMVSYVDGSVLAQLGSTDMRIPISYALGWPDRIETPVESLNLTEISSLTFEKPDFQKFPSLKLAQNALKAGKIGPILLNSANEIAVSSFLENKISFLEIAEIVEDVLSVAQFKEPKTIEDIVHIDLEGRKIAENMVNCKNSVI
jgi:1-deoxy-D-xylulose-5-phosphate reductoisomerase